MIALPAGTQIWIAAGITDMRKGFPGVSATVQTEMEANTFSGHIFVFRGRRGDLIKLLWWDGDGLCLFAKRLADGRFVWPQAESGRVSLSPVQLSMLLEGRLAPSDPHPDAEARGVAIKRNVMVTSVVRLLCHGVVHDSKQRSPTGTGHSGY